MAVTVRTYQVNSGLPLWNSNHVLDTLQTALADLGYHAGAQTGTILTFTNTVGTTIAAERGKRYLVKQFSTSGSGQYAVFDILRNSSTGAVGTVTLVNGGINYVNANTLLIKGSQIGGVDTTDDLTITVSTVSGSQGTTSTWYDADTASPYTWGVCCVNIDQTKRMGQTFYSFYMAPLTAPTQSPVLYIRSYPSWQSTTNVCNGVSGLDFFSTNAPTTTTQQAFSQVIASSNAVPLTLKVYQSGIDNKFAVFQFSETSNYGALYRWPFFLSAYTATATQPWSLDDCFTGGIYHIIKSQASSTYDANIAIQLAGATMGKRQGEWGYHGIQTTFAGLQSINGTYESIYGRRIVGTLTTNVPVNFPVIYQRTNNDLIHFGVEYNPVITGIPICHTMVPCPYFIPADFGITEIVGTNSLEYGDLVSVGATTKWTVLQFANNQSVATYNGAIAFVAKTVD